MYMKNILHNILEYLPVMKNDYFDSYQLHKTLLKTTLLEYIYSVLATHQINNL